MNALLRYAFIKSRRQNLLPAVLLAPLITIVAPLLGMAVRHIVIGQHAYPFRIDPETSPAVLAGQLSSLALVIATIGAGVAAFYIFRAEMASRSIGLFVLANRPRAVAGTASLYGAITGFLSFLLAMAAITILTSAAPPDAGLHLAVAATGAFAAGAVGAAMVVISPEVTMLTIVYVAAGAIALTLLNQPEALRFAVAIVAAALLITAIPIALRYRCAA